VYLLFSNNLLSDYLQDTAVGLGILILVVRVVHPGISLLVYKGIFGASKSYSELLDKGNYIYIYKQVLVLSVLIINSTRSPISVCQSVWFSTMYNNL
jgi:uncharacterized membrane-anchored protein